MNETLHAWKNVRGIECGIDFFIEPSDRLEDVLQVIETSGITGRLHLNPYKYGELHNPWVAVDWEFSQGSDFVICAEDDDIVSTDILEYFQAATELSSPNTVLGVSAYTSNSAGSIGAMGVYPYWGGLVWGTWKESWHAHLRDTWDHDYSTFNGSPGVESGFDWNINTRIMPEIGKGCVMPEISRVRHIGKHGVHVREQDFENVAQSPSFNLVRDPGTVFYVVS